jgi:nitrous oxidase accessory protein
VWQPDYEKGLGARSENVFYENGQGNYWSDYTGTDHQGDGLGDTPYHETDVYGYLLDRYPEARVFALSPALAVLRKTEELLPVVDLPGVVDLYPLMRPMKGSP